MPAKESSTMMEALARDNEGFLLNPEDWNIEIAELIAEEMDLEMNDARWEIVNFVRDHYELNQSVPELRRLLQSLRKTMGKDKATRGYVQGLFPYGYGQQACKIAGVRKPLKLMLDL